MVVLYKNSDWHWSQIKLIFKKQCLERKNQYLMKLASRKIH